MDYNVNQLVRSAVVFLIGAPISLAILANVPEKARESEVETLKQELSVPCLRFMVTNPDSKGERAAQDQIDELFGDGANYPAVCKWVLG